MCAKRFLAVLFILGALCIHESPSVSAQPSGAYVLSSRVEAEIDTADRDYFNLFPSIDGFLSAYGTETGDGSVRFAIRRRNDEGLSDTAIYIGGDTLQVLKQYIEEYESLFRFEKKLEGMHMIVSHVRPGLVTGDPLPVRVETREGELITGQVVLSTDSTLVLWRGDGPYDWRRLDDHLVVLHSSRIERLEQRSFPLWEVIGSATAVGLTGVAARFVQINSVPEQVLIGIGGGSIVYGLTTLDDIDFRVGGNPDAYRAQQEKFHDRRMFARQWPPELIRGMRHRENAPGLRSSVAPVSLERLESDAVVLRRFHVHFGRYWGMPLGKNESDVLDLTSVRGGKVAGTAVVGVEGWEGGIEYSLGERIRVGAMYSVVYEPEDRDDRINEYVRGNVAAVTGSFVLVPSSLYRARPFEVSAGGGLMLYDHSYITTRKITSIRNPPNDTLYDGRGSLFGLMLRGRLEYYTTENYSVWIGLEGRLFPPITVPEPDRIRKLEELMVEHRINPSSIGLTFGAQIHF